MKRLSSDIVQFFRMEGFAIVSTIDRYGRPHSSCKGIVKITTTGRVYLFDLYRANTFNNLKRNPRISLTLVDEHKFRGFCLKGKAKIVTGTKLNPALIRAWEDKITSRITSRLLKNIQGQKGHHKHAEALLPKPKYMIVVEVEEVVDLKPSHID